MKKKTLVSMLLVAAIAVQSMTVFAAKSPDSDDSGSSSGSSSTSTVTVSKDGTVSTGDTLSSTSAGGSTIAVVVDTTTATGTPITVNEKGEAIVGDHTISFANGSAATAGLPEETVDTIGRINNGEPLSSIITGLDLTKSQAIQDGKVVGLSTAPQMDLTGYYALTGTHAIVTKNAATGQVMDTPTETVIYVPNLVDGLNEVSVLYYDNATGRWLLLPVTKVDPVSKLVYVNVTGSGTLSVIYKK